MRLTTNTKEMTMIAIRYEQTERKEGEYLNASRVWVDSYPTEDMLPGTCCLILEQDKYSGAQYVKAGFSHKYLVEGIWVADGEDDGEVILDNCKVLEDLNANPEAIEDYI